MQFNKHLVAAVQDPSSTLLEDGATGNDRHRSFADARRASKAGAIRIGRTWHLIAPHTNLFECSWGPCPGATKAGLRGSIWLVIIEPGKEVIVPPVARRYN
jgi:hypothetical protein